jgi:hypothetical protein
MKQGSPICVRRKAYFDIVIGPLGEELRSVFESDPGALVLLEGSLFLLDSWL